MAVTINNSNGTKQIHTAERLQIFLISAEEDVQRMEIKVWFNIETRLSNEELVGQIYWDSNNPLDLSCENDIELAEAMKVIQQKIGIARYAQITASIEISESTENPKMPTSTE